MDINQANSPEKSEPAVSSTTPDEQLGTPTPARTYECTFCKRGFSNAQALGGHMNIHRKDKAKLKQANEPPPPPPPPPQQQQQFLELPKMISSDIPTNLFPQITTKNALVAPPLELIKAAAAGDHQERSNNWTWNFCTSSELDDATSRSSDHPALKGDHQLRQLPLLFTETLASNPENQKQPDKELAGPDDHDQLDLELRLGHEPSESSSAAKGTRKFF